MIVTHPQFSFRAGRNYIHTTDLYDRLVEHVEAAGFGTVTGALRLTIRKVMHNALELHILGPAAGSEVSKPADASVDMSVVTADGSIVRAWYVETDRPLTERVAYDEAPIHALCALDGQSIRLAGDSRRTPIEVITSLAVKLHNTLAPPSAGVKWLDSRLDLIRPLCAADGHDVSVTLRHRVGTSLTRSEISTPAGVIGNIFFSLGNPG
ncbi:hypothetical protein CU669_00145 [Paramagnetospirillum kuznetsovii]|uniref:Uncharacterized protein n=1 Tax=Paramagnetospirillum kuznetsovii TaxID=2053833 RepID=A0A364P374_9PROT|nr:hypothetical protein [Paramagnetospirillum kuznetsovii]RAU23555.1 hypothetical protein CU669_00145 [Paramagnetospirillum kuznetsovii]